MHPADCGGHFVEKYFVHVLKNTRLTPNHQFLTCSLSLFVKSIECNCQPKYLIAFMPIRLPNLNNQVGKPSGAADLRLGLSTAPVIFAVQDHPDLKAMMARKFSEAGDVEKVFQVKQGLRK